MSDYLRASLCRTANASEANLFFVPLESTCAMQYDSASTSAARRKRNPHIAQQRAVHDAVRFIKREYRSLWEVRLRTINLAKLTNQRVGCQKIAFFEFCRANRGATALTTFGSLRTIWVPV